MWACFLTGNNNYGFWQTLCSHWKDNPDWVNINVFAIFPTNLDFSSNVNMWNAMQTDR
jgi:hypothetical protein